MKNIISAANFFCPTNVHLGQGSIQTLGQILSELKTHSLLLVMDSVILSTPAGQSIVDQLKSLNIKFDVFSDIAPDPTDEMVLNGFAKLNSISANTLVAVGGGSTMDVAKAIGILATNGGRIQDYEGIKKFSTPPLPLIAVPTTAGTGSEVSGSCVITDYATGRKMSIRHASLNPARHAILDPDVLRTLPAHVAAHAGVDAFVHALESFTSRQANLITDAINFAAMRMLSQNLAAFVQDRTNTEAALNCLVGSSLTGMVFGQTGVGNVHCMARFVGAKYHVSHGLSNALCLPVVARFNAQAVPEKYAQVAQAMGLCGPSTPTTEAVEMAIAAIEKLCRDVGIPDGLRKVGAKPEDFTEMAKDCLKAGYNQWNPRETTEADFLALFEQAY